MIALQIPCPEEFKNYFQKAQKIIAEAYALLITYKDEIAAIPRIAFYSAEVLLLNYLRKANDDCFLSPHTVLNIIETYKEDIATLTVALVYSGKCLCLPEGKEGDVIRLPRYGKFNSLQYMEETRFFKERLPKENDMLVRLPVKAPEFNLLLVSLRDDGDLGLVFSNNDLNKPDTDFLLIKPL